MTDLVHLTDSAGYIAAQAAAEADAVPARSAQRADGHGEADAGVPCSNTGRQIDEDISVLGSESSATSGSLPYGVAIDGSDWVETCIGNGHHVTQLRTSIPNAAALPNAALVDWIAFTVRPPQDMTHEWAIRELQNLGLLGVIEEMHGGYAGYTSKAQYHLEKIRQCLIAWGGKNQAGTVYFSFTGHGCARISDWLTLAAWLEQHKATITRLDLAYDDFTGKHINIAKAVEWYQKGGFSSGGRQPKHRVHGDWLLGNESKAGRTLEIGSRESGKMARIYEKGRQLGDTESPWVRVEVEWHNEARLIPYLALLEPGRYLSGAYECLRFLDQVQSRVETTQRAAKVTFDRAMFNGRQLAGKLLNMALEVYEGDYAEVVEQLRRDGYPARVEPFWHSVSESPQMLVEGQQSMSPPSQMGGKL